MTQHTSRKPGLTLSLAAVLVLFVSVAGAQILLDSASSEQARIDALLTESSRAMAAVHDYRGTLVKRELFGDELVEQTLAFKFARPFKVYVKFIEPHKGRQGLYVRGSNRNRLRAHKGGGPDLSVTLSPFGRIAMEGNHHPITSFGIERMLEVVTRNVRKAIRRKDASLRLREGEIINGDPTWCIEVESQSVGRYVTARQSENLWQLSKRVGQNMYVLLHHNEGIDSPRDLREGQRVFVPHYYGSEGKYFISKRTSLMIKAMTWDHYGRLYESYEYLYLELNPGLEDREFDYRNKDYNFMIIRHR